MKFYRFFFAALTGVMRITFLIVVLIHLKVFSQQRIFIHENNKFGPCLNYLNFLGYNYTFADLKKDSLFYRGTEHRWEATFIQDKKGILSARIYDNNKTLIVGGSLENGNGELAIQDRYFLRFRNGKLNDTTFIKVNGGKQDIYVFRDNILVYELKISFTGRTIRKYDENGLPHDSLLVYGAMPTRVPTPYHSTYIDPYEGRLYQVMIYEHGQLKEEIFFKKNGDIKSKQQYKIYRQPLLKRLPSNCL